MSLLSREDVRVSRELVFVDDPDGDDRNLPCHGCSDYCDLKETDPDLHEAYGVRYCAGVDHHRKIVLWQVVLRWYPTGPAGDVSLLVTTARELCDAEADMERRLPGLIANWCADRLEADGDDP